MPDSEPAEASPFADVPFAPNPEPRLPVIVLVHGSPTLRRDGRDRLLDGAVMAFVAEVSRDPTARRRVEVATFGEAAHPAWDVPRPLGPSVVAAIAAARSRFAFLAGRVPTHRPKILLFCDGDSASGHEEAIQEIATGEASGEFDFLAIDVGEGSSATSPLRDLSFREPMRLRGLEFAAMSSWLAGRVSAAARCQVGDEASFEAPPSRWAA